MKITSIDCFVLTVPTPRPLALQFPQHKLVVADIATDQGIRGLGYSLVFGGGGAEPICSYLETRLKPVLLGEDPLFVERLWQKMFGADIGMRKQGVAGCALSVLDIALWDIAGKIAGLPLYKLWGAATDKVPAYGSGGFSCYSEGELIEEAQKYALLGCRYYKMKIHSPDARENATRVESLHRALGDGVRLMVDVNQRLDVDANIRQAKMLEDLDLLWYEEPVLADDIPACAEVAGAIGIPIATGENNYTHWEFRELVERRAAKYLMPDVGRACGFSETLRIGHHAAAHGIALSPHLVHELSVHVVGALSNGFLVEYMDWTPPDLFEQMPQCSEGCFLIPERAGHGMSLAPGAVEKYRSR